MNQLQNTTAQQFFSEEFGALEVVLLNDKPYFPATECAKMLGYSNPQKAVRDHCKGVNESFTPSNGGTQKKNYIPEGDLYRLIIRSHLPSAERFEKFVFDEVLPSLRKFGLYATPQTLESLMNSPDFAIHLFQEIKNERDKNAVLSTKVATLAPKASYCDKILSCKNAVPVTVIAKDYGMSGQGFNRLLHGLHIQYRLGEAWVLYQPHANKGYTKSRTYQIDEETAVVHTYWTQKGRFFLFDRLSFSGIYPISTTI